MLAQDRALSCSDVMVKLFLTCPRCDLSGSSLHSLFARCELKTVTLKFRADQMIRATPVPKLDFQTVVRNLVSAL